VFAVTLKDVIPEQYAMLVVLMPGILAIFSGGLIQGRLLPKTLFMHWAVSGLVNACIPVFFQVMYAQDKWFWITDVNSLLTIASGTAIWSLGAWTGQFSEQRRPSANFDSLLFKFLCGAAAILVALYLFTWASVHFSQAYKIAKTIDLHLPPDVQELDMNILGSGVFTGRRFTTVENANELRIYEFYREDYEGRGFEDVSSKFQSWEKGKWVTRTEEINGEKIEYQVLSTHWKEPLGKVLISLLLQAEKTKMETAWDKTQWNIIGLIITRTYMEPPPVPPGSTPLVTETGETPTSPAYDNDMQHDPPAPDKNDVSKGEE